MRAASFEMVRPIYYPSLTKGRSKMAVKVQTASYIATS